MSARFKAIALLLAFAAVVAVQFVPWTFETRPAVLRSVARLGGEWVDQPAADFELPDLAGKPHRLDEWRGQVVFLNFWASFCEPCRDEMPSMERLVRQYKDRGMVMVAVTSDPEKADADKFMQAFLPGERSAMTVLWDPTNATAHRYGTQLIPETYIIDRDGRIVARFVNAYDWTRPEVKQLIESLLES